LLRSRLISSFDEFQRWPSNHDPLDHDFPRKERHKPVLEKNLVDPSFETATWEAPEGFHLFESQATKKIQAKAGRTQLHARGFACLFERRFTELRRGKIGGQDQSQGNGQDPNGKGANYYELFSCGHGI
jgi:hypothetical protein